jgi:cell division protein FtsQ
MVIFFRRGVVALSIFIFIAIVVLVTKMSERTFLIKNILISGNYHLEEEEIKSVLNIRSGENLSRLSFDELETRLKRLPWIKKVSLRKQFPSILMINIEEAVPKALLSFGRHLFLIDSGGNILEEIIGKGTSFLPVITGINPEKDRGSVLEALKLIDALSEKNILSGKESVEIMLSSHGLVMNVDGESIKVGYGEYREKLERWKELEPEIRKKNINIDYVDLRFKDKVIVKPLKIIQGDKGAKG